MIEFIENEIWKDVDGYENSYQVSNYGRVKSLGNKSNHKNPIILKQAIVMEYPCITLTKNSKAKMFKVHRLVASAFCEKTDENHEVNHIDGNKENNFYKNLEWVSKSENMIHAFKLGLKKEKKGKYNKRSIPVLQIDVDSGETVNRFEGLREMERNTGFSRPNVKAVCGKKNRTAYGWRWEYAKKQ
jgi:hypothetical protein